MKYLILIALIMTSDVIGEYIDVYNKRSEIVEFAYKTVNVIPNQSRQPLLKTGMGDLLKEPGYLTGISSTVSAV